MGQGQQSWKKLKEIEKVQKLWCEQKSAAGGGIRTDTKT